MAAPKNKPTGTDVAKQPEEPQRGVIPGVQMADDAMLAEMEGVASAGLSTNPEDRGTPFLFIAQKSSKALVKQRPEFIKGLEVGNAYNTVTGEQFDAENEGVPFLPCFFKAIYNEWTPVDEGGGFHGSHPLDTPLLNEATAKKSVKGDDRRDAFDLPNGNELILTHEYWGVLPSSWDPIIVAMSATNLGASKKMQGLIGAQKVQVPNRGLIVKPGYFTTFLLKTGFETNDSGDFYKWIPSVVGPNEDANLRAFCKELAIQCARGALKAANPPGAVPDTGPKDIPV